MKNNGFTLIELMVALAIMAMLMTVALPGYQQLIIRGERSDVKLFLTRLAQSQAEYYYLTTQYTTLANLNLDDAVDQLDNYRVNMTVNNGAMPPSWVATVTRQDGRDMDCLEYSMSNITYDATNSKCWEQ
ncbi:MAG: prepilin-type N-terminal cleavage/methylation domain-containing protein [Gammaproteobacteria bacterium]|nr:prepilin-type N-terminal cleavage/methylation domain-containing protein [Gammaproteobacteria bacterium]